LACGLLLLSACSDKTFHAESISLIAADSLDYPGGAKPSLYLTCEQGRVAAYVVVGPPGEEDKERPANRGVEVEFDSALACSDSGY
jgi:hypothetical protein